MAQESDRNLLLILGLLLLGALTCCHEIYWFHFHKRNFPRFPQEYRSQKYKKILQKLHPREFFEIILWGPVPLVRLWFLLRQSGMVSPEEIVAATKQRSLDSHELSYKSGASRHFLAPGARGRTQNASSGSFYREHMGQGILQRPIEGETGLLQITAQLEKL